MTTFHVGVEGFSDQGVVTAILRECGGATPKFFGMRGKQDLLKRLTSYNEAARWSPWLVLVDLDNEPCVASARSAWLASPSEYMCFRIAVREAEAWLLADREKAAEFLAVSVARIPPDPDLLPDPKRKIVDLARSSRSRAVRHDLVPSATSGASVGPAYPAEIRRYAETLWRPTVAAESSPSLARCLRRVRALVEHARHLA